MCEHKCHETGLNDWIETCHVCGCENPNYDKNAVSDIEYVEPMNFETALGAILGLSAMVDKKRKDTD